VRSAYPALCPADIDETAFAVAFAFVSVAGRQDTVDETRYLVTFAEAAMAWAKSRGAAVEIKPNMILAACIAAGDVPFRIPSSHEGIVAAVGLHLLGSTGRQADHEAWRGLLRGTRNLLPATPPRLSQLPPLPPRSTITQGDRHVGAGPQIQSW
jgi:hypothetical protein